MGTGEASSSSEARTCSAMRSVSMATRRSSGASMLNMMHVAPTKSMRKRRAASRSAWVGKRAFVRCSRVAGAAAADAAADVVAAVVVAGTAPDDVVVSVGDVCSCCCCC